MTSYMYGTFYNHLDKSQNDTVPIHVQKKERKIFFHILSNYHFASMSNNTANKEFVLKANSFVILRASDKPCFVTAGFRFRF